MQVIKYVLNNSDIQTRLHVVQFSSTGYQEYNCGALANGYTYVITHLACFYLAGSLKMMRVNIVSNNILVLFRQNAPSENQAYGLATQVLAKPGDYVQLGVDVTTAPTTCYLSYQFYRIPSL